MGSSDFDQGVESGMVSAYRLVSPRWADSAFSGMGARKYGGRWNSPGREVVYLAGSRALAALEILVHLPTPASRRKPFVLYEIELPRELVDPRPQPLPEDWHRSPPLPAPIALGNRWLTEVHRPSLELPSAIVPEESIYLLDPNHPDFGHLRIGKPRPFSFDPRLAGWSG